MPYTFTTAQGIRAAITAFRKNVPHGDIRTILLMEGSGSEGKWSRLAIRIEYAVNGDYTESDKAPVQIDIRRDDNGIKATFGRVEKGDTTC